MMQRVQVKKGSKNLSSQHQAGRTSIAGGAYGAIPALQKLANNSQGVKRINALQGLVDTRYATVQGVEEDIRQDKAAKDTDLIQRNENPQRGNGLPQDLKSGIENLSGISMGDVTVQRNSAEPAKVGAHAYAQGTNIHLGPGQDKHLPHEAWHVVQQKQGRVKPTIQMKGVAINDDAGLEREADVMGAKALQLSNLTTAHDDSGENRSDVKPIGIFQKIAVNGVKTLQPIQLQTMALKGPDPFVVQLKLAPGPHITIEDCNLRAGQSFMSGKTPVSSGVAFHVIANGSSDGFFGIGIGAKTHHSYGYLNPRSDANTGWIRDKALKSNPAAVVPDGPSNAEKIAAISDAYEKLKWIAANLAKEENPDFKYWGVKQIYADNRVHDWMEKSMLGGEGRDILSALEFDFDITEKTARRKILAEPAKRVAEATLARAADRRIIPSLAIANGDTAYDKQAKDIINSFCTDSLANHPVPTVHPATPAHLAILAARKAATRAKLITDYGHQLSGNQKVVLDEFNKVFQSAQDRGYPVHTQAFAESLIPIAIGSHFISAPGTTDGPVLRR